MAIVRIREIHVDREQTRIGEVHHPGAIGAQRRREVVVLLPPGAHERARPGRHDRSQPRLGAFGAVLRQRDAGRHGDGLRCLDQGAVPVGDQAVGGTVRHLLE